MSEACGPAGVNSGGFLLKVGAAVPVVTDQGPRSPLGQQPSFSATTSFRVQQISENCTSRLLRNPIQRGFGANSAS